MTFYEKIVELQKLGVPAAIATVVSTGGSAPQKAAAKMVVTLEGQIFGTIGGGAIEKAIVEEAMVVIRTRKPQMVEHHLTFDLGMCCGGKMEVYIEPLEEIMELVIFGAGHLGRALAKLAKPVGYIITVVDDRPEYASSDNVPEADKLLCGDFEKTAMTLDLGPNSYILIATYEHQWDKEICGICAGKDWAYLGVIGSRRKVATTTQYLEEIGISNRVIDRIHMPVGLNIGAITPEEIAVSILSEMIAVHRGVARIGKMKHTGRRKARKRPAESKLTSGN